MKAGIVIDDWKLPIFKRRLAEKGYVHLSGPGPSRGTLLLTVETENIDALGIVIQAAQDEAAKTRGAR